MSGREAGTTYGRWLRTRLADISTNGTGGIKRMLHDVYERAGTKIRPERNSEQGAMIFEADWDLMVVLDACRFDVMAAVAEDYDWLPAPSCVQSAGTGTRPWMEANFHPDYASEMADTVYVTANPWSDSTCPHDKFADVDEVWQYGHDEDLHVTPPRVITDRAIEAGRESNAGRYLVHYLQPHAPFLEDIEMNVALVDDYEESIWRSILRGRVDRETIMDAYKRNLHEVLSDVQLLLDNFDAETATITSDHGNAIGEWGFYGHGGPAIAARVNVPWIETTATDTRSHDPEPVTVNSSQSVRDKLSDLGYLS
jgi:hypothetical protein